MKIRWPMEVLILLPWALPASTVAINMINAFNRMNLFSFYTVLVGTYWILPLTYFVGMLTLVVRSTSASMRQMDRSLEEASRSLGAGWVTTFRRVVVPIVAPGILAGGLLGFIGAVGEYTSSALMYTVANVPISVAMTNAMYNFDIGLSMTYGILQIALTLTIVVLARGVGRVGELRF
jgi:iron(III) transport system permease protein